VEKKKALKAAREASKGGPALKDDRKKDNKKKDDRKKDDLSKRSQEQYSEKTHSWWVGKNHWATKDKAMKGVPARQ